MDITGDSLLDKLLSFEISADDDEISFKDRLARENNWPKEFAGRCAEEYRKFLYLMSISKNHVTPSDQIDQAWHLHLTYTHSYWNDLCRGLLKQELHHNPTKGGDSESKKFEEQYQETLNLYKKTFGEKPPKDIWPNVKKRFKNADKFIRISNSIYWVFPKPSPLKFTSLMFKNLYESIFNTLKILFILGGFFSSFVALTYINDATGIPIPLIIIVALVAIIYFGFKFFGWNLTSKSDESGSSEGG